MKTTKTNRNAEWQRLIWWQRAFSHSDWAWMITPRKLRAFDEAWYDYITGKKERAVQLKDFI